MKITALMHSKITALLLKAAHENYKVTEKITEVKVKSKSTTKMELIIITLVNGITVVIKIKGLTHGVIIV